MNFEFGNNLRTWNLLCYALATLVTAIAIAHATLPMPDPKAAKRDGKGRLDLAKTERDIAQKELDERKSESAAVWEGEASTITPQILQSVTMIAKAQGVNLKSFRPQNPVADGNISRASFSVMVDGPFPKVVSFIRALDAESSRLGVNLVQMAAVDQQGDTVGATIGVIAYVRMPDVKKPSTGGTNNSQSTKDSALEQPDSKKPQSEPNLGPQPTSSQGDANKKNGGNE